MQEVDVPRIGATDDSHEGESAEPVKVYCARNGSCMVWDAPSAHTLRTRHRICGSLIGCFPRHTMQNQVLSLPLTLLPEEVSVLLKIGAVTLIADNVERYVKPTILDVAGVEGDRVRDEAAQLKALREGREQRSAEFRAAALAKQAQETANATATSTTATTTTHASATTIISDETKLASASLGTKRKATDSVVEDDTTASNKRPLLNPSSPTAARVAAAISAILPATDAMDSPEPSTRLAASVASAQNHAREVERRQHDETKLYNSLRVALHRTPYACQVVSPGDSAASQLQWTYPHNEYDRLRTRVFTDLWERGYHVTSGSKFGGDYLAYPGSPFRYHAHYVVIIVPLDKQLSPLDIVSWGRLGTTVKKAPLVCSVDQDDRIVYLSIEWTGAN